jgi:hypothetical protein
MEFNTTITLSKQYRLQHKDSPSAGLFFGVPGIWNNPVEQFPSALGFFVLQKVY